MILAIEIYRFLAKHVCAHIHQNAARLKACTLSLIKILELFGLLQCSYLARDILSTADDLQEAKYAEKLLLPVPEVASERYNV